MLLDIIQDENKLHVSYWGEDGKTHIEVVDVPEKEQFVWLTEPKNKKDEKSKSVKNWNGLPVFKHKINTLLLYYIKYKQKIHIVLPKWSSIIIYIKSLGNL